ncbi:hypothetical protein IQ258_27090 [Coleofasciculus sp. LEGE 07081]|nr:hypothetical protein [Coleofasciculus sp. LEGE 07081]
MSKISAFSIIRNVNASINAWFTQPEVNAAGRIGLFRILYSFFYLWHLSIHSADFLSGLPSFYVDVIVSLALIFHAVNAIWLVVTTTPILIGYCIFIDWQAIKDFFFPSLKQESSAHTVSPKLLTLLPLFLATILGLLWHSNLGLRTLFNLNGLINWRTVWYPILPIALGWFVATLIHFRKPARI